MAKPTTTMPNAHPMRVAHLSTSRTGGAAVAARRIVAAQRVVGLDADLWYRGAGPRDEESPPVSNRGLGLDHRQRLVSRIFTISNSVVTKSPSVLFTPWSTSIPKGRIRRELRDIRIIHVHNIYNFVQIGALLEGLPHARIVATLHDERLITSGCHYSLGCDRLATQCHPCPQNRLPKGIGMARQSVIRKLSGENRFSIVTPSRWLAAQAKLAGFPADRISHIPNPIDPGLFPLKEPKKRNSDRGLVVAWLPGKMEAPFWEGVRLVNERLKRRDSKSIVKVLTPAESTPPDLSVKRVRAPKTETDRARFWSSADVGVSLTMADNFPNVVLESLAVGTPFIINDVGGSSEAIRETSGGVVIKKPSAIALADELEGVMQRASSWMATGMKGAEGVRSLYSPERVGKLYDTHYQLVTK